MKSVFPTIFQFFLANRRFLLGLLLTSIVLIGFLIRLYSFSYPITSLESHRDYLIGRHIAVYGEMISSVDTGAHDFFKSSPLYYYILASFLYIHDDITFLGLMNILLQVLNIFLLYLLAKTLFGKFVALLSVSLLSVSSIMVEQTRFIWSPYLMQPFLTTSLLLLALSYKTKNMYLLTLSAVFLVLAVSIHLSAIAVIPIVTILTITILVKCKASFANYLSVFSIFVLAFIATFYKSFNYIFVQTNTTISDLFSGAHVVRDIPIYISNVYKGSSELLSNLFQTNNHFLYIILTTTFAVSVIVYFWNKKDSQRKIITVMLFMSVLSFILLGSLVNGFPYHYLSSAYALSYILIAEVISSLFFLRKKTLLGLGTVFFALIAFTVSVNYINFSKKPDFFQGNIYLESVSEKVVKEILSIQTTQKFDSLSFFQITLFEENPSAIILGYPFGQNIDAVLWNLLEINLDTKFTTIGSQYEYFNYTTTNDDAYVFLMCSGYKMHTGPIFSNKCISSFSASYANYSHEKSLVMGEPFSIYLMKKL